MSRDRRALIVGGAVALAAWLALRAAPSALTRLRQDEAVLEQRAEVLARARARVADLQTIDDSLVAFDALAAGLPSVLLIGRDAETAGVDLMRRVRELAAAEPVVLSGFEGRSAVGADGPLELVTITASLESDLPGLLALIERVEADPAVAIETLDVAAADAHREDVERLTTRLGVSGWFRPLDAPVSPNAETFSR